MENENYNNINDPYQNLKDYIGDDEEIPVNITIRKSDILKFVLKICLVYGINQSGMADLFYMTNCVLQTDIFPDTRYKVDKIFNVKDDIEYHAICSNCEKYISTFKPDTESVVCRVCNHTVDLKDPTYNNFFVIIKIKNIITRLILEDYDHFSNVSRNQRNHFNLKNWSDITDGWLYKQIVNESLTNENIDIATVTFNTVGAPVFKSS